MTTKPAPPGLRSTRWTSPSRAPTRRRWEKVIGKLRAGSMPPPGIPRPMQPLIGRGDHARKRNSTRPGRPIPIPGRIGAVHRLNRAEYNNAIRDLFALDLDVKPLLPGDDTADGSFDNFADVAFDFDGSPGAIHVGGPPGHAPRDGSASRPTGSGEIRDPVARSARRPAERRPAVRVARRHRDSLRLSRSTASTSSRFGSSGNIRITSRAWAGRRSSIFAWMASC